MLNGQNTAIVELMAMQSAWRDLAIRWELSWGERRSLFPAGGEDRHDPPEDTERRMRILIEVGHRLRFDDEAELCEWLRCPAEMLKWNSPLEVMAGGLPELRRFRQIVELGFAS